MSTHAQMWSSSFSLVDNFRFSQIAELPSETKEGFPLRTDRQWQHQQMAGYPYQTESLTKYK